jgi:colanic acid biosynthesis glycosyl transferase WcaI
MRISLITITYPPEIGGAAHLIHELALGLQKRGHSVCVLTGFPSYHLSQIPEKYLKGSRLDENLDGIKVSRIRFPQLPPKSMISRGLQHFIYGIWLTILSAVSPKPDVVLVFSPPLPLPWLICLQGKLRRVPIVVNIQDLFPREAVELGMLNNRLLISIFERMERAVYQLATSVTVHSPGNQAHVFDQRGKPDKVDIVYNWVNVDQIQPGPRTNKFSQQYGLDSKFVVSYAGTMGWAQDMGTIVAGAQKLRDHKDILFLMVGEGVEKDKALAKSVELGLENILWLPMQPLSVYPDVLAASDISMINLHPELRTPVVPSKLLSIMAAGRPVVASLPLESDARLIMADARCGICVEAGDGDGLAEAILHIKEDNRLAKEMGTSGRAYVKAHFSPEICISQIENILVKAIGR